MEGVVLDLTPQNPPEHLYHGTVEKFISSIRTQGLQKMGRNHVHLSATIDTAKSVGARRGKPIVIVISAQNMANDGLSFYLSKNGVWLTNEVPIKYIVKEID